jgi:hypothetical protein
VEVLRDSLEVVRYPVSMEVEEVNSELVLLRKAVVRRQGCLQDSFGLEVQASCLSTDLFDLSDMVVVEVEVFEFVHLLVWECVPDVQIVFLLGSKGRPVQTYVA